MRRHGPAQYVLGFATCVVVGLSLTLWRLGLAPAYAYLISINAMALLLYGHDKRQAIVDRMRVPEIVLHVAALLGGSPGAFLAQRLFRHKTRKLRFQAVFVAIVLLQAAALYGYWRYLRG
jgi:uncharacterized membrane protein YsdA (DUF1294 family)